MAHKAVDAVDDKALDDFLDWLYGVHLSSGGASSGREYGVPVRDRRDELSDGAYVRLSVLSLLRKIMQHNWRSGAMELRITGSVLPGE